ncbi:ethanolamine ammonia-lyase reactivating factor EutA [Pontibacillus litoralis]|uniref:Ethanolamine ammonia lyase n=1 Tax=Pontibacillus litoralis JSM 072002 TaxID=1385512 RepID=A0A0A5G0A2_9BACI|nr:ethanolamine ammonia-lyase reactivating factor EutA [Pontibacillus litoralis]KGX84503.1 ethanolamine ammonia lyase [Pontibacillus litoralis JSM 072002]
MRETILSVGIDIGTSTTQLIFSNITIENMASNFTVPRIVIVDKEVIYRSNIAFTPIIENNKIDQSLIQRFVEEEYRKAGIRKEDTQTGAVIITGETARKENAEEVLNALSGFAGEFVVATAGPDLESIIAAKGAGISEYSADNSATVVNLDIGGGTSNLAVLHRGEVIDTGCLDIGGRLIKVHRTNKTIEYISPKIQQMIEQKGWNIQVGQQATEALLQPVVDEMVQLLKQSVGVQEKSAFYETIITHKGLKDHKQITHISFTGGVADAFYHGAAGDVFIYGDIGIMLGQALAKSKLAELFTIVKPKETIRATVVGAGSHTTEISGSTIFYTDTIFPIKNIPVLKLTSAEEQIDESMIATAIKEKVTWFESEGDRQNIAVSLQGKKNAKFQEVQTIAAGIAKGMEESIQAGYPLIVIVENDMAKALGQALQSLVGKHHNIVCIDSIQVENGDYIDIGHPVAEGSVLPVVIKTLVFH